jgi:hypothetical protein
VSLRVPRRAHTGGPGRRLLLAFLILAVPSRANAQEPSEAGACVDASDQGQSERDLGKYRAARKSFLTCSREVCPQVVLRSCAAWLRELDQTAPTLVLGARDERGNDIADVNVTFDGASFASHLDGRPIEVDSGEHVLRFERAGSDPVEERLVLRAGERARVVTVTLRTPTTESASVPVVVPDREGPPREPLASARHLTVVGLTFGALAAAGTGLFFTLHAAQQNRDAAGMRGSLPANACMGAATPSCQSLADTVSSEHAGINTATAFYAGAGALVAAAITTWFFWPRGDATGAPAQIGLAPLPSGILFSASGSLR